MTHDGPMSEAVAGAGADQTLAALLDRCQAFAPEYGDGLSTHLPMALHALHSLGAPPARLHALFDRIAPGLQPRGSARHTAPPMLGQIDDFEAWRALFAAELARDGQPALLARHLPRLMPGVAGVAFHGLIRTAHGLAACHTGELLSGLAYWAARYAPLVPAEADIAPASQAATDVIEAIDANSTQTAFMPTSTTRGGLALPDWLTALQALRPPGGAPARLIAGRMQAWAPVPGFAAAASALRIDADTLDALARRAALLYAASGNFTVLHLVTACQALRQLLPWLGEPAPALRQFSIAAAAALRASGWPGLKMTAPGAPPAGWHDTVAAAIAANDEHVIKLVAACRAHEAATGDPAYQAAAARAVQPPTA